MSFNGDEPDEFPPFSADYNVLAARTSVWQHAALQIDNERRITDYPVDARDAARLTRLAELVGEIASAIGRGHSDLFDENSKVIALMTAWNEDLARR